jgi:hypothetical protein
VRAAYFGGKYAYEQYLHSDDDGALPFGRQRVRYGSPEEKPYNPCELWEQISAAKTHLRENGLYTDRSISAAFDWRGESNAYQFGTKDNPGTGASG